MSSHAPACFEHILKYHAEVFQHAPSENAGKRKLFIVISSDKGLCGGIHSSVSKATRRAFADKESPVDESSPVMVIGDKSKAQLSRAIPRNLVMSFNQIGRDIPTFADAAGVADLILTSGAQYDSVAIVYNKFVSAISYESAIIEVETEDLLKESRTCLCRTSYLVAYQVTSQSWLQDLRDGGRCHEGLGRVLPG